MGDEQNLYYAILQLGPTPTCTYAALGTYPTGNAYVVSLNASTYIHDLGIGINSSTGTTVIYRSRRDNADDFILEYESTCPDGGLTESKSLSATIDSLAATWLSTRHPNAVE